MKGYFLNFNNHPSTAWATQQQQAALELAGPIVDRPFPFIPPEAGAEEVRQLARQEWEKIQRDYEGWPAVVLVQGDFTFTFSFVSLLLREGVRCVAATTQRQVEKLADGREIRKFVFVQFRDYLP